MMRVSVGVVLTVTTFVSMCVTPCVRGYASCQLHEQTDDGVLRFTEEMNKVHVGYENQYTNLVCSTLNFCDISWEKDDLPVNTSELVGLENNRQNLVFKKLSQDDAGIYTCEAFNGINTIKTTIKLYVISSDCGARFKPINLQQNSCNNVTAKIGDNVAFDCRFFIGLPKKESSTFFRVNKSVDSSASRLKKWIPLTSSSFVGGTTFNMSQNSCGGLVKNGMKCKCQDCKSELCLKFSIFNLSVEAFGTYIVTVNNFWKDSVVALEVTQAPDLPRPSIKPKDWHLFLTVPVGCLLMLVGLVWLVGKRLNTDIRLKWKDFTGKTDDSKMYDVYLSYDWSSEIDRGFAINLARRLGDRGYRVFWEIHCPPGGFADDDILECLKTSCRCVIIFSPDYLASHRNFDVIFAMDNAKNYKKEIIPIVHRDISIAAEEEHGALVKQILSMPCLRYDRIQSRPVNKIQKVWQSIFNPPFSEKSLLKELLLRMPSKPPQKSRPSSDMNQDMNQDMTLISAEVPRHESSKESLEKYETADSSCGKDLGNGKVSAGQTASRVTGTSISAGSRLYPDLNRLANDFELNSI